MHFVLFSFSSQFFSFLVIMKYLKLLWVCDETSIFFLFRLFSVFVIVIATTFYDFGLYYFHELNGYYSSNGEHRGHLGRVVS